MDLYLETEKEIKEGFLKRFFSLSVVGKKMPKGTSFKFFFAIKNLHQMNPTDVGFIFLFHFPIGQ
jgi:hypothetical protein